MTDDIKKAAEKPQVSEQTHINDMVNEVLNALEGATKVVGWYAHPGQVRGPFGRWLEVTPVPEKYKHNVGTQAEDAVYAAACMNFAPSLAEAVIKFQSEITRLKEANRILREGLEKVSQFESLALDDSKTVLKKHNMMAMFSREAIEQAAKVVGEG